MSTRKPLFETVAMKLEDMILINGKFAPGEKLPGEFELAVLFGVGRTTIREAIRILVSKEIIYISRGNGTYVSEKLVMGKDGHLYLPGISKSTENVVQWMAGHREVAEYISRMVVYSRTDQDLKKLASSQKLFLESMRNQDPEGVQRAMDDWMKLLTSMLQREIPKEYSSCLDWTDENWMNEQKRWNTILEGINQGEL